MVLPTQTLFERGQPVEDDDPGFAIVRYAFGGDVAVALGNAITSNWAVKIYRAELDGSVTGGVLQPLPQMTSTSVLKFDPQVLVSNNRLHIAHKTQWDDLGEPVNAQVVTWAIGPDLTLTYVGTRSIDTSPDIRYLIADEVGQQFLITGSPGEATEVVRWPVDGRPSRFSINQPDMVITPDGQHRRYIGFPYYQDRIFLWEYYSGTGGWLSGRTFYNSYQTLTLDGVVLGTPSTDENIPPLFLMTSPTSGGVRLASGAWEKVDVAFYNTVSAAGTANPESEDPPIRPQTQVGYPNLYGVGLVWDGATFAMKVKQDLFDDSQDLYGPAENWIPRRAWLTSQGRWLVFSYRGGTETKVAQWGEQIPLMLEKTPYRGSRYFLYTSAGGAETSLRLRGPMGDNPYADRHLGTFQISENRMVSMQFRVATVSKILVDVYAQWLRISQDAFIAEGQDPLIQDLIVDYDDDPAVWAEVSAYTGRVPNNVSHWRPKIVFSHLVDGVKQPLATGQQVALDGFYVLESGRPLAGQSYLDGDQPEGRWEGEVHNSTSVRGMPEPQSGPNIVLPENLVINESESSTPAATEVNLDLVKVFASSTWVRPDGSTVVASGGTVTDLALLQDEDPATYVEWASFGTASIAGVRFEFPAFTLPPDPVQVEIHLVARRMVDPNGDMEIAIGQNSLNTGVTHTLYDSDPGYVFPSPSADPAATWPLMETRTFTIPISEAEWGPDWQDFRDSAASGDVWVYIGHSGGDHPSVGTPSKISVHELWLRVVE